MAEQAVHDVSARVKSRSIDHTVPTEWTDDPHGNDALTRANELNQNDHEAPDSSSPYAVDQVSRQNNVLGRLQHSRSSQGHSRSSHLIHYQWPIAKKTPNRLIDIHTMRLKDITGTAPPYAILSHRWTGEEVSYADYGTEAVENNSGHRKIVQFCMYMRHLNSSGDDGKHDYMGPLVEHVWVDTCCIDKRSSAELTESINSMAAWYKNSAFCVAYLYDVDDAESDDWAQFRASEWFTRGWTLQELLFPPAVAFCNKDWHEFTWMNPLEREATILVSEISGIPPQCLRNSRAALNKSIATRLSWAANRRTTRKEDEAYCLLGLLDINMPLIYGEGERAFIRLQEEIIKQVDDESILAWTMDADPWRMLSVLATSPTQFKDCNVTRRHIQSRKPYGITNHGLQLTSNCVELESVRLGTSLQAEVILIQLNCCYVTEQGLRPCFIAVVQQSEGHLYRRVCPSRDVWPDLRDRSSKVSLRAEQTFQIAAGPMNRRHAYKVLDMQEGEADLNLYETLMKAGTTSETPNDFV